MAIRSYRDLEAWQRAMDLAVSVYALTAILPREELYGLTAQMRRAAVSIPSNIGEGHQRGTKGYLYFITLALGSLAEVETQLELARRLGLVAESDVGSVGAKTAELGRLLHGLRRALDRRLESVPDP